MYVIFRVQGGAKHASVNRANRVSLPPSLRPHPRPRVPSALWGWRREEVAYWEDCGGLPAGYFVGFGELSVGAPGIFQSYLKHGDSRASWVFCKVGREVSQREPLCGYAHEDDAFVRGNEVQSEFSLSGSFAIKTTRPMSATLRERLRKTRSSFNSCYSVVKRLKVEDEENDQTSSEKPTSSTEEDHLEFPENFKHIDNEHEKNTYFKNTFKDTNAYESKSLDTGSCSDLQNDSANENIPKQGLNEEKTKLMKQVQEKEDLLRRLKLVKMYRSKNDLSQLQSLIKKWRHCSQLLLYELQSALSEENKKLSLTQLIDSYGLDDKLLHYNRNEEEFIDV
ncbi:Swi5-dependent recombination DNA repair protein 1 [Galemys pyrenaicus]|uniref:Swi5-dependent recombination DNA repair protein 1 homolog n=1 Tax=Galemys pyrenaicus TaxID=202257 RepID=A0A8J6ALB0_GALPY|nr:Swi5-dependent recombination DNA repair protein 1 [Galemys pyrenaicus]